MNRTPETQADNLIDATLATLRTTAPPTGLEDRLLRTLEEAQQRTSESEQPRVWVPHVRGPRRAYLLGGVGISFLRHGWIADIFSQRLWAGTALAAAAFAITFAVHLHHRSNPTQASTNTAVELPRNTTVPVEQQPTVLIPRHVAHSPTHPLFLSIPQRSGGTCISPADCTATVKNANHKQPPTPYEQAALADALAPSHRAPPLPLTQQERLLLRCTRHSQPIEVAEPDLAHQPEFQPAIAAHDTARLQERLKDLLHSLVGYQQFDPTPPSDEAPPPSAPPDPVQQQPVQQPIVSH